MDGSIDLKIETVEKRVRALELLADLEERLTKLERGEEQKAANPPFWARIEARVAGLGVLFTLSASLLTGLVGYITTYRELLIAEDSMVKEHLEQALSKDVTDVEHLDHLRRIRFLMSLDTESVSGLLVPS